MAQWLGVHVGISSVTARQQVAVARQLVILPAVREAFGSGSVSYSRVRAICRIATPTDEHEWVELARHATATQLERIVSDTIRCVNASDPDLPARQSAARRFAWRVDDDGMFHLSGVLAPEIGVLLAKLVAGERDAVPAPGDDFGQRNADAFGRLVQRLATGDTPGPATVLTWFTATRTAPPGWRVAHRSRPIPRSGSPLSPTPSGSRRRIRRVRSVSGAVIAVRCRACAAISTNATVAAGSLGVAPRNVSPHTTSRNGSATAAKQSQRTWCFCARDITVPSTSADGRSSGIPKPVTSRSATRTAAHTRPATPPVTRT